MFIRNGARWALLACITAAIGPPVGASEPGAEDTVRRMSEKYRQLDRYTFEFLDVYSLNGSRYQRKILFSRPDHYYIDGIDYGPRDVRLVQIINEKGRWLYSPELQQYMSIPGKTTTHPAVEVYWVERLSAHMKSAEFLADQPLDVAGQSHPCTVVRVVCGEEGVVTLWIDKERDLVLRLISTGRLPNG